VSNKYQGETFVKRYVPESLCEAVEDHLEAFDRCNNLLALATTDVLKTLRELNERLNGSSPPSTRP
jgi:hypothetical protein